MMLIFLLIFMLIAAAMIISIVFVYFAFDCFLLMFRFISRCFIFHAYADI